MKMWSCLINFHVLKIKQLMKCLPSSDEKGKSSLSRSRYALRECLKVAEDSNPEMFKTFLILFLPAVVSFLS
jgi:hypothetical protein